MRELGLEEKSEAPSCNNVPLLKCEKYNGRARTQTEPYREMEKKIDLDFF